MLAVCAVPAAQADLAPERAEISYLYLNYQDFQTHWDRVTVHANAVSLLLPIAGEWSVGGSWTRDVVSGASPAFHSEQLLAGEFEEKRYGREFHVSRYFPRSTVTVGLTDSQESDYTARGYSINASLSTESKNTTLNLGLATGHDRIDAPGVGIRHETKNTDNWMVGITQILGATDIVQLNYSQLQGRGFYTDPYKLRDNRPRNREQHAWMLRWNHHFRAPGSSLRSSYRYYRDSFGIDAHTLSVEYVQPLPHDWTVTPMLRLYSQSAADFYLDPENPPFPVIRPRGDVQSQDQRLSAFGAFTWGLKLSKAWKPHLLADVQFERYEQHSAWRAFGSGSPGIDAFKATMLQIGMTWYF